MAESRDTHVVVEIPSDGDHQNPQEEEEDLSVMQQHHPLTEISRSPGHLLLLKLWQREEDIIGCRIMAVESRIDGLKREAFHLCCLFFAFHGLSLTLFITAGQSACKKWWVPSFVSLLTSLVLVCAVQVRIRGYWRAQRKLAAERGEGRALARCVQELRMKGASFDLSKGPTVSKRMKRSSVEISWWPLRWCQENSVAICLLCFTGLLFPACRFILCG